MLARLILQSLLIIKRIQLPELMELLIRRLYKERIHFHLHSHHQNIQHFMPIPMLMTCLAFFIGLLAILWSRGAPMS